MFTVVYFQRMSQFVLFYKSSTDPSEQEERALLRALKNIEIIDRSPGSIWVKGDESVLLLGLQKYPEWTFAPVSNLNVRPPHKKMSLPI